MNLVHLLLQVSVILALCRVLRWLSQRAGQPAVIGEIIAGLLLGPSFFGVAAPAWYGRMFPPSSLPLLNLLSQLGLVLFMFLVGFRFDLHEMNVTGRIAGVVGVASIAVPFLAGIALSVPLHAFVPETPMLPFSLFAAVAMSITAFPVLARVLHDQRLTETRLGQVAIACAAFNDLAAWILLAGITALARSGDGAASVLKTLGALGMYGIAMGWVARPLLRHLMGRFPGTGELQAMVAFACLSSWMTEWAGIHAFFGAFLAGAIWPRQAEMKRDSRELLDKLETVTMTILVPLFFTFTGLRTNLGSIQGGKAWLYAVAIIAVAVATKIGGAFLGGLVLRFGARESLALGALLNTRGLVELIALNIGLDLGILSPALFSMLVLMAIVTTLMTVPLLRGILPAERSRVASC